LLVEGVEEGLPDPYQDAFSLPFREPSPTGAGRRVLLREVSPAGTASEDPQYSFEASPIIGRWATATGGTLALWKIRFDSLPLCIREKDFLSPGHRKGLLSMALIT
jgi:hypothetical protein